MRRGNVVRAKGQPMCLNFQRIRTNIATKTPHTLSIYYAMFNDRYFKTQQKRKENGLYLIAHKTYGAANKLWFSKKNERMFTCRWTWIPLLCESFCFHSSRLSHSCGFRMWCVILVSVFPRDAAKNWGNQIMSSLLTYKSTHILTCMKQNPIKLFQFNRCSVSHHRSNEAIEWEQMREKKEAKFNLAENKHQAKETMK